jgi:hypothetical protein
MTGGERSWVGSIPPLLHTFFCLVLISYLSIYLLSTVSYLLSLLYLSVHNHFLTVRMLQMIVVSTVYIIIQHACMLQMYQHIHNISIS